MYNYNVKCWRFWSQLHIQNPLLKLLCTVTSTGAVNLDPTGAWSKVGLQTTQTSRSNFFSFKSWQLWKSYNGSYYWCWHEFVKQYLIFLHHDKLQNTRLVSCYLYYEYIDEHFRGARRNWWRGVLLSFPLPCSPPLSFSFPSAPYPPLRSRAPLTSKGSWRNVVSYHSSVLTWHRLVWESHWWQSFWAGLLTILCKSVANTNAYTSWKMYGQYFYQYLH